MAASGGGGGGGEAERPVQLVRIDNDGKCHLGDEAAAILGDTHGRLAVVGIAGLYRTGKSFLLNRLLGRQAGFEVGPTVNPCTKGIWMWGRPVSLAPNYHCLLIDTEGLGSAQRTTSCDMQIFSLCVLLSSYFIYNSMGAIDEQAIEDLHLVLNLARHIHVRSASAAGGEADDGELPRYLPSFLWVLRDFHLRLVDGRGASITAREYLENALQPVPGEEAMSSVRGAVRDLFPQRDCVTLARPVAEEADLRHVEKLPYESLRPEFRTQVEAFVSKVFAALKPKQIGGTAVSGPMFLTLASEYCQAINNSAVPAIQSAWTSAVQHHLRTCLRDAVHEYTRQMQEEVLGQLPVSEALLQDRHRVAEAEALRLFHEPGFDESEPSFLERRAELASRIGRLREQAEADNAEASRRQCQAVAEELYAEAVGDKLSSFGSYCSFDELTSDWARLRAEYLQRTTGPAQAEVLGSWLMERMTESMKRVHDQLHGAAAERAERADERCEALRQEHARALDEERRLLRSSLDEATNQLLVEREDMVRRMEVVSEGAALEREAGKERREAEEKLPWRRTQPSPPVLREGGRAPPLAPPAAARGRAPAQESASQGAALPTRTLDGRPVAKRLARRSSDLASTVIVEQGQPSDAASVLSCRTVPPAVSSTTALPVPPALSSSATLPVPSALSSSMTLPVSVSSLKPAERESAAAGPPQPAGRYAPVERRSDLEPPLAGLPGRGGPFSTHTAAELELEPHGADLSSPEVRQECGPCHAQ